jgi:TonB family protein
LLVVSGVQAQTPVRSELSKWELYTVKDENFTVALPALPAMHTTYPFIERVQRTGKMRELGVYADGVVYTIHIYENPEPQESINAFIERQPGPVLHSGQSRDLTLNGFAGKAVGFADRSIGIRYYFTAEDRVYVFGAIGAPEDDGRVKKFFSSLSLKKKKGSVEVSDGQGVPYKPKSESGASTWAADEKPMSGKDVDKKVRLALKPDPQYTEEARQNAVTGTVILKCVFASNGSVTDLRIISGLPYGLTERAIDAAKKIKFIPAVKDGKYVSMWMQLEYNFNLY